MTNLLAQNVFHRTTREAYINGYRIPKGTVCLPQISALLYDEKVGGVCLTLFDMWKCKREQLPLGLSRAWGIQAGAISWWVRKTAQLRRVCAVLRRQTVGVSICGDNLVIFLNLGNVSVKVSVICIFLRNYANLRENSDFSANGIVLISRQSM